jgi:hypothetical protein
MGGKGVPAHGVPDNGGNATSHIFAASNNGLDLEGTFPLKGANPTHLEGKIKYPNSALFLPNSQKNQKNFLKIRP